MIWGACSKLGENCPHHKYFEAESQLHSKPRRRILHIGYVKYSTIQQSVFDYIGMNERPCKRKKTISLVDSRDVEEDYCKEQGMRQTSAVNSFSACPWVMTIVANSKTNELHSFQTLDDIPKQVVVPRDIQ